MRIGPAKAASSRRASDHPDQSGSSVTRSSRTFVSTRITSVLAACHRHDLVRAQALSGMATQPGEAVWPSLPLDFDYDDPAVLSALEIDHAARADPKQV